MASSKKAGRSKRSFWTFLWSNLYIFFVRLLVSPIVCIHEVVGATPPPKEQVTASAPPGGRLPRANRAATAPLAHALARPASVLDWLYAILLILLALLCIWYIATNVLTVEPAPKRQRTRRSSDVEAGNPEETAGTPTTQAMPESPRTSPRTWTPQPPPSSEHPGPGFFKTDNPTISTNKKRQDAGQDAFFIRVTHYPKPGSKSGSSRRSSKTFPTREAAENGIHDFRMSFEPQSGPVPAPGESARSLPLVPKSAGAQKRACAANRMAVVAAAAEPIPNHSPWTPSTPTQTPTPPTARHVDPVDPANVCVLAPHPAHTTALRRVNYYAHRLPVVQASIEARLAQEKLLNNATLSNAGRNLCDLLYRTPADEIPIAPEDNPQPPLEEGQEPTEPLSQTQLWRLHMQATCTSHYISLIRFRDQLVCNALITLLAVTEAPEGCDHATREAALKVARNEIDNIMRVNSLKNLARRTADTAFLAATVGYTTVQSYHREFEALYGHFAADRRGSYERAWIFNEEDLKAKLRMYSMSFRGLEGRDLTIDDVNKFVNTKLFEFKTVLEMDAYSKDYNLKLPVPFSTMHCWMHKLGMSYDPKTKSYYTDGHNTPVVTESRAEFIATYKNLQRRMHMWVHVPSNTIPESVPMSARRSFTVPTVSADGIYLETQWDEIHVDYLGEMKIDDGSSVDCFTKFRNDTADGGFLSRWFNEAARAPCAYNHSEEVCKCGNVAIMYGQDESVYHCFASPGKEWKWDGVGNLHKKSLGAGVMVSAIQSEHDGFGMPMTEDQLRDYNADRVARDLAPITCSPGICYLVYGKNKDGYWDWSKFKDQVVDILDCFDWLHRDDPKQMVLLCDWSAGHAKHREGGLNATAASVGYGGVQPAMRDSTVTTGCLGDARVKRKVKLPGGGTAWVEQNRVLQDGSVQSMQYRPSTPDDPIPSDGPPFDAPDAPVKDFIPENHPSKMKYVRPKKGQPAPPRVEVANIVEGYAGKPKGLKQILWERGLWKEGMTKTHVNPALNMEKVLASCPDFVAETGALQELVESKGHILLMSPKYHPEIAGAGIEYSWGQWKRMFKQWINDHKPKNHEANVKRALSPEVLDLAFVRKTGRRTRDYMRAYIDPRAPAEYTMIEKVKKEQKSHRGIKNL